MSTHVTPQIWKGSELELDIYDMRTNKTKPKIIKAWRDGHVADEDIPNGRTVNEGGLLRQVTELVAKLVKIKNN